MNENQPDPKIEKLLSQIKLKEPKPAEMKDYLSKVHSKIELKQDRNQILFVPGGAALVLVLALSGFIYWMVQNQPKPAVQIPAVSKISEPIPQIVSAKQLSLAEEMAVLEAFSEEYPIGTSDLLGAEGTMEDLVLIDEIELTVLQRSS